MRPRPTHPGSRPARPSGSPRPLRARPALAFLAVAMLAACGDSPTDPMAGLVAGDTGLAALALELPLPAPVEDGRAEAAWRDSWTRPVLEGRAARDDLYRTLARARAFQADDAELAEAVGFLRTGVRRASSLDLDVLPAFLAAGVAEARARLRSADRAALAGDATRAWEDLLRGADALREIGPEAVARTAVARADEAYRRIQADAPYTEKERERIRRLVWGGRQALEEGDWAGAIRRAYYAEGLLAGNG